MKKFFLFLSIVSASVPGIAALTKDVATPPGHGGLFGALVEVLCMLTLAILWINRERVRLLDVGKVTRQMILLGIAALLLLGVYYVFMNKCVVEHETQGIAYYPLWLDGKISRMVDRTGGRYEAIEEYKIGDVRKEIRSMAARTPYAFPVTTGLLLLLYLSVMWSVTVAFALAGLRRPEA